MKGLTVIAIMSLTVIVMGKETNKSVRPNVETKSLYVYILVISPAGQLVPKLISSRDRCDSLVTMCQSCCVPLVVSGHNKGRYKREEDPADLPDVGFISSKQNRRQTRPMSEVIPDGVPYSSRRKDKRRSLQLSYTGSSSDDDERTNRAVEEKKRGTFAVGLASRNIEHTEPEGESDSDHEETCEYCAAEKVWTSQIVTNLNSPALGWSARLI